MERCDIDIEIAVDLVTDEFAGEGRTPKQGNLRVSLYTIIDRSLCCKRKFTAFTERLHGAIVVVTLRERVVGCKQPDDVKQLRESEK